MNATITNKCKNTFTDKKAIQKTLEINKLRKSLGLNLLKIEKFEKPIEKKDDKKVNHEIEKNIKCKISNAKKISIKRKLEVKHNNFFFDLLDNDVDAWLENLAFKKDDKNIEKKIKQIHDKPENHKKHKTFKVDGLQSKFKKNDILVLEDFEITSEKNIGIEKLVKLNDFKTSSTSKIISINDEKLVDEDQFSNDENTDKQTNMIKPVIMEFTSNNEKTKIKTSSDNNKNNIMSNFDDEVSEAFFETPNTNENNEIKFKKKKKIMNINSRLKVFPEKKYSAYSNELFNNDDFLKFDYYNFDFFLNDNKQKKVILNKTIDSEINMVNESNVINENIKNNTIEKKKNSDLISSSFLNDINNVITKKNDMVDIPIANNLNDDTCDSEFTDKTMNFLKKENYVNQDICNISQQKNSEKNTFDDDNKYEITTDNKKKVFEVGSILKLLKCSNFIKKKTDEQLEKEKKEKELHKNSEIFNLIFTIEKKALENELLKNKKYLNLIENDKKIFFFELLQKRLKSKKIFKDNNFFEFFNSKNTYKSYDPHVELHYVDGSGNELNTINAFKFMSRKFHGYKKNDKSNLKN